MTLLQQGWSAKYSMLLRVLLTFGRIYPTIHWLQIVQVVSTTKCLGFGMVNIPPHWTCLSIRGFVHCIAIFVLSVQIRIFPSYSLTLIPNLIKPFFRIISHSIAFLLNMLTALGNGEELRHLNRQEDWLKTAVVFGNELLSTTICR